jgi:hypothetical protein
MIARLSLPLLLVLALGATPPAAAAQEPAPPPTPPPTLPVPEPDRPAAPEDAPVEAQPVDDDDEALPVRRGLQVRPRLFGLAGFQSFTASESFKAVLDTSSGPVFGGGGGVLFGRNLFVDVSVSRFSATGTRVFITSGGEVIDLGIDTDVTVTPIDVSIGWRFAGTPRLDARGRPRFRAVPFVGGGFGVQQYEEVSEFAEPGDDVSESKGSYHVLGGIELPFSRRLGVAADALYRFVPDAIGAGGVSAYYDEDDLGGVQVRLRVMFTF